jgi:putative DNA primase/helicase
LATDEYREEMDVLAEFMDEQCIIGTGQRVTLKDLYLAYAAWCDELNQRPQNYRLFNRQMKERNYKVRVLRVNGKNSKCWDGISLQDNKVAAPSFISMRIADA